jgi:hypothetical protein
MHDTKSRQGKKASSSIHNATYNPRAKQSKARQCIPPRKGKARTKGQKTKGKVQGARGKRQGKARQGKARQGKARQSKARQGKVRQGKAR